MPRKGERKRKSGKVQSRREGRYHTGTSTSRSVLSTGIRWRVTSTCTSTCTTASVVSTATIRIFTVLPWRSAIGVEGLLRLVEVVHCLRCLQQLCGIADHDIVWMALVCVIESEGSRMIQSSRSSSAAVHHQIRLWKVRRSVELHLTEIVV